MKRSIAKLLILCMLATLLPAMAASAEPVVPSAVGISNLPSGAGTVSDGVDFRSLAEGNVYYARQNTRCS